MFKGELDLSRARGAKAQRRQQNPNIYFHLCQKDKLLLHVQKRHLHDYEYEE